MHILKQFLLNRFHRYRHIHPRLLSSLVMISAASSAAFVAILYAKAMDWATTTMMDMAAQHRMIFFILAPFWFVLAWALVSFLEPEAGGSGIPQVLAAVELAEDSESRSSIASFGKNMRLILVKIASSLATVLGGGVVGREGPTIQISAAVFELYENVFRKFITKHRSRESLLIAGGGAGLAAAFNTPLGGVVFAIEELAKNHFKYFKGVLILAVVTSGYVTQALLGPYLFVGHVSIGSLAFKDTFLGLSVALIVGVIGAAFGRLLFFAMHHIGRLSRKRRLVLAFGVGLLTASVCLFEGGLSGGGGNLLIRSLLFSETKTVSWALVLWRTLGIVVTYISGCAGGIFAPGLAAGAAIGAKCAELVSSGNPNLIIVLGMIGFLSGVTRSPFTSFILVFEMTDRQAAVMPMMAAALLASLSAQLVEEVPFYEKTKEVILARSKPSKEISNERNHAAH